MQTVLLLSITLRTNWDKEVSKTTEYSQEILAHDQICFVDLSVTYVFALVGFEGKGQGFQFFPACRLGNMRHTRQDAQFSLSREISQGDVHGDEEPMRNWLLKWCFTGMCNSSSQKHPEMGDPLW